MIRMLSLNVVLKILIHQVLPMKVQLDLPNIMKIPKEED